MVMVVRNRQEWLDVDSHMAVGKGREVPIVYLELNVFQHGLHNLFFIKLDYCFAVVGKLSFTPTNHQSTSSFSKKKEKEQGGGAIPRKSSWK